MYLTQSDIRPTFGHEILANNRHPKGWVTVKFDDGEKDLPIQQVIVNAPIWGILHAMDMKVKTKHVFIKDTYSNDLLKKAMTKIFLEVKDRCPERIQEFVTAIWDCANTINELGAFELAEHHCTISLPDLAEIMNEPAMKAITDVDLTNRFGTNVIEMTLNDVRGKMCKLLGTKGALKNDTLLHFQQTNNINPNQMTQALVAFGLRTEVNDIVIPRAVQGSSLTMMRDIRDIAIEPHAARKAAVMNHAAIQESQYWGRKDQLLLSAILGIVPGDCGAHKTIEVILNKTNMWCYVGKNYIADDGHIAHINVDNMEALIDIPLQMITVGGCRHRHGVCETCFGQLHLTIPKTMNLGLVSATTMVSKVSQMILSTKHLIKTLSKIYELPPHAEEVFQRNIKGISLHPTFHKEMKNKEWYLGIDQRDLYGGRSDLIELDRDLPIPEDRFSSIHSAYIKFTSDDGRDIFYELPLDVNDVRPYLASEFILTMKDKYQDIVQEDQLLWIPMKNLPNMPIFRSLIINDSMSEYVERVKAFLESKPLSKHKTFQGAIEHFTELIWSKVNINIAHLEVILRAHMIHDENDWSIPTNPDLNNVTFAPTGRILQRRTLSEMMSFEGHNAHFMRPQTYVIPSTRGPFDPFYDFDRHWIRGKLG